MVHGDDPIPASDGALGVAVGWSFVMNSARLLSTLGTAFVLAGLLGPKAFGTVALALLFVSLVQLLIQQGMVPAIVQRPALTWRHLDSAFWMTLVLSIGLTGLSAAIAPTWASVNGVPEARNVIWVLSGLITIKGLVVVQEGFLQRQLHFRDLAIRTTIASATGAAVGITWAIVHPSVWALVGQQLVGAVVGAIVVWSVTPWRPRPRYRSDDVRDLVGFASKSTVSSFGVFVNTRVDALLIGVFFGATAVGLYQIAYRLVHSAVEATVYPIAGVALADLSRHRGDGDRMAERYEGLAGLCAVIAAPVMAVIFACARPLMQTLGPEWEPAAPALQFLCVVGVVTAIGMVNSPAIQAAGRPGAQAWLVWFGAAVSAVTFTVAGLLLSDRSINAQLVGMAASRAVVYVVVLLPISQLVLLPRIVGVRPVRFARAVAPPIGASVLAAAAGLAVQAIPTLSDAPSLAVLAVVACVTSALALVLVSLMSPYAGLIVDRLRSAARRRSSSNSAASSSSAPSSEAEPDQEVGMRRS